MREGRLGARAWVAPTPAPTPNTRTHPPTQDGEMVELLIKNGADVNKGCQDFGSPLHLLAKRGPVKTLKLLLDNGADATVLNEDGWSPLQLAARAGNADKVSALASAAPSLVSAPNATGNCALHLASLNGHAPAVAALMAAGADAGVKNKEGKTAAEVAKNDDVRAALQK
jgi:ankyrin repeat protein